MASDHPFPPDYCGFGRPLRAGQIDTPRFTLPPNTVLFLFLPLLSGGFCLLSLFSARALGLLDSFQPPPATNAGTDGMSKTKFVRGSLFGPSWFPLDQLNKVVLVKFLKDAGHVALSR